MAGLWGLGLLLLGTASEAREICTALHCQYRFTVRWGRTMTYTTPDGTSSYNVVADGSRLRLVGNRYRTEPDPYIGSYVDPADVITGDGYPREIILVNDQFPAPTLQVMEGALITVHVTNMLLTEGLTIHWHGMRQMNNTWMDGIPYVTQFPIMPRQTFEYRFRARPAGTHWYHSHFMDQRVNGLYGMLIVHRTLPQIQEFHVTVSDWFHVNGQILSAASTFHLEHPGTGEFQMAPNTAHNPQDTLDQLAYETGFVLNVPHDEAMNGSGTAGGAHSPDMGGDGMGDMDDMGGMDDHMSASPYGERYSDQNHISIVANGRGRFVDKALPLTTFSIVSGHVYKFRVANAAAHLPMFLSIDQHELLIVASDGGAIWPIAAQTLIIFPGESMDFEIKANQKPGKYWVRMEGKHGAHSMKGKAILSYAQTNFSDKALNDPVSEDRSCTQEHKCVYFNCPQAAFPQEANKTCMSMAESRSLYIDAKDEYWLSKEDDLTELFLNMGLTYAPHFNGIKYLPPSLPYHLQSEHSETICDKSACQNGCSCTHKISLPFDKTIDLVITNYDALDQHVIYGHHPVHLHGHNFAILKQGFPTINTTTGELIPNPDIVCNTTLCNTPRWRHAKPRDYNIHDPPIKDTVVVPSLGYAVVRFHTDNPGRWLLHCHIDFHSVTGMTVIFEEAVDLIPTPPVEIKTQIPTYSNEDNLGDKTQVEQEYDFIQKVTITGREYIQMALWSGIGLILGSFALGLIIPVLVILCIKCNKCVSRQTK